MAQYADVFYIGGTKQGLLFGEAVVITHPSLKEDFRYMIKHNGGMLAKGRLLGVQFETAFEDDLYMEMARHAILLADMIRATLKKHNVEFWVENNTNQIFPIFSDSVLAQLGNKYCFEYQKIIYVDISAVRICTSWASKAVSVEQLCMDLEKIL